MPENSAKSRQSKVSDELQAATSDTKGPAPQPPTVIASVTQARDSNVGQNDGAGSVVTRQPQR